MQASGSVPPEAALPTAAPSVTVILIAFRGKGQVFRGKGKIRVSALPESGRCVRRIKHMIIDPGRFRSMRPYLGMRVSAQRPASDRKRHMSAAPRASQ